MAEVVGIVASILTVCQVVADGVSRVNELYKAPTEIKTIQEQVEVFRNVIQAVEATTRGSAQESLQGTLFRALRIIEEMNQVITTKLIRQGDGSNRARRRAWLKNKSKVMSLRDNLKDARETLWVALSADLLSSTRRVETTLNIIGQQATRGQSTTLSVNQELENIENAIHTQKPTRGTKLALSIIRPVLKAFESPICDDGNITTLLEKNRELPWRPQTQLQPLNTWHSQADPASPFEMSASFRPEAYAVLNTTPVLFGYYRSEVHATEYTRVNQCAMFYAQTPRQWTRLTVSITTGVESQYWNVGNINSVTPVLKNSHQLPIRLTSILETFLRSCQELEQDSHLSLYLGNLDLDKSEEKSKMPVKFGKAPFEVKSYIREITRMVHHWNCPRFFDTQLIQRPLYEPQPNQYFIAYLQGRWVYELRFGSSKPQIDAVLYILQVLHCLKGVPGINPFIGVVVDQDSTVSALLCELPVKGRLLDIINEANESGQPVTWERREKWCRQLVKVVAEVHAKGFVVGCLGERPDCGTAVDADDNIVLYSRFRKIATYHAIGLVMPPEDRLSAPFGNPITVLPHFDIFQLGLLLWQIANNVHYLTPLALCEIAGCPMKANDLCTKPHTEPIQLPSPRTHAPQYLREVINACRAEDPHERPPAWKLLKLFPPMEENSSEHAKVVNRGHIISPPDPLATPIDKLHKSHSIQQVASGHGSPTQSNLKYFLRPEECFERWGVTILCDICGKKTNQHFFQCNICHLADFNLCVPCFSQGLHCLDRDHFLQESVGGNLKDRYYTAVRETGCRNVVTL